MFDIDSLIALLKSQSDEKYRRFNESLIPGAEDTSLGVRMPALRSIAKEILKDDPYGFLNAGLSRPIHEIRLLHGIVLGGLKCSINDKIALTERFLPHINNWAVCDTFCSSFKPCPSEKKILFSFLKECAESNEEYRKRFGLVMMMNYYHDDEWIDSVLEVYRKFNHEGYYARMAAAWGLATLYVYCPESILQILRDNHYDDFTHNKAIQKMIESYRISDKDKEMLRTLRRKQEKK